jgi:ABC-type phosphate transport system substrate-binding protein
VEEEPKKETAPSTEGHVQAVAASPAPFGGYVSLGYAQGFLIISVIVLIVVIVARRRKSSQGWKEKAVV